MTDQIIQKALVIPEKYVAMFKRIVPQYHYITKKINLEIDFEKAIRDNKPILFKESKHWPQDVRDKLDYYHLTITIFNKIVKNETHCTYYELLAIADIIGCNLEINFKALKK